MRFVVAPSTELGAEILARLRSWSESGLLGEVCWWTVSDEDPYGVDRLASGELHRERLSHALEHVDRDEIRFVALCPLAPGDDGSGFPAEVDAALARLQEVVGFKTGETLLPVMLVAPSTVRQPISRTVFRAAARANLLVSPENRRGPAAPNVLADTPSVFPSHVAHALATVADLWAGSGADELSFLDAVEEFQREAAPQSVGVIVARCFSRFVDLGYLPDYVAAEIFRPQGGEWPNPDRTRFDRDPRVDHVDAKLSEVAKDYLSRHPRILGLTPFTAVEPPKIQEISLLDAMRIVVHELVAALLRRPFDWIDRHAGDFVEWAASQLEGMIGPERTWKVKRWRKELSGVRDPKELGGKIAGAILAEGAVDASDAWEDLLRLAFGLIDGSSLPADLGEDDLGLGGKRLVVPDPDRIVPDPQMPPPAASIEHDERVCDPRRFRAQPAVEPSDGWTIGEPTGALDPALAEWLATRARTPLWIVGEGILEATDEARSRLAEPVVEALLANSPADLPVGQVPRPKPRRGFFRRMFRLLTRTLSVVVLGLLASVLGWVYLPFLVAVLVQGVVVAFVFGGLVKMARRRQTIDSAAFEQRRKAELAVLNDSLERSLRERDLERLEEMYSTYLDWAEVIGWLAHGPWVGERLDRVAVRSAVDGTTLPPSLAVAIGQPGEHVDGVRHTALEEIFQPGWLVNLLEEIVSDFRKVGVDEETPTHDQSHDPDSPRRRFVAAIRSGEFRRIDTSRLAEKLLRTLEQLPVNAAAGSIVQVDEDSTGVEPLAPSTAWFTPPADLAEMTAMLEPMVVRLDTKRYVPGGVRAAGGTGVLISDDGLVATARHVIVGADAIAVTFSDGTVRPASIEREAPATDVAVVRIVGDVPAIAKTASLAGPRMTIRQGDPVLTMGYPLLHEGEATLAWGLITATDRMINVNEPPPGVTRFSVLQATYAAVGGASGSPVFDLDGLLIGIHSAGSAAVEGNERAQYMSFAVPVSELHTLLEEKAAADGTEVAGKLVLRNAHAAAVPAMEAVTAEEFIADLVGGMRGVELMRGSWTDLEHEAHPARTLKRPDVAHANGVSVRSFRGELRYFEPVRIGVHTLELVAPVRPTDLTYCATADSSSHGEETAPPDAEPPLDDEDLPSS